MGKSFESKVVVDGRASGQVLFSNKPLSFWGGVDVATGKVLDVHHDLCGRSVTGRVLCIPYDRGSCSGSGIMLEMLRTGCAPAAIICLEAEPVLSLGSVMGKKIYGRYVVIHTVGREVYGALKNCAEIILREGGGLEAG